MALMWRLYLSICVLCPSIVLAEPILNPFTGKFDYTGSVSTSSLSGSFVLKAGDSMTGSLQWGATTYGPVLKDVSNCTWLISISTSGNLVSTLQSCVAGTSGQCMGLLCAITYP